MIGNCGSVITDDGEALYGRPGEELVGGLAEQVVRRRVKFDELGVKGQTGRVASIPL